MLISLQASAAEFPWFKVRDSYQGFVEFIEGNQTTRNIYILPVLGIAGTAFYQDKPWGFSAPTSNTGLQIDENGDCYLNFKIHTNNDHLPDDFKQEVINHITGKGFSMAKYKNLSSANYLINFIKPQNIKVSLYIENKLFDSKVYSGILDGNFRDKFLVSFSNLNALRLGNFELKIEYDFPYQKFSSLSINIKEELLTKVKIDVFKELIQQSSSSSGGFFIWKWKQQTHRVIEKNRVNFEASNSDASDISIVYRDATPEMMERISTILGFYATTKAQLIEAHKAAYNAAMNNGNTNLGNLHKNYAEAVQADDISKSIDVLKAAAALSEGNLFMFLASGVAFSDAYSSSYSSFHGIKKVDIKTTATAAYNEVMINTVTSKFLGTGFKPVNLKDAINDAYRQKNVSIFNTPSYLPLYTTTWVEPFFQAVINSDLKTTKYLTTYFTPIAQVNAIREGTFNTALHIAAQNGNYELVEQLIKFGVNLKLKNRYIETAKDIAIEKGFTNIVSLLQAKENELGTVEVEFNLPPGHFLEAIHYYPLDLPYMPGLDNRDKVQIFTNKKITFKYYPGTYPISFYVYYTDPMGMRKSTEVSNIYRIKKTGTISYNENLIYSPLIQALSNGSKMYMGSMSDPVYIDY